MSFRKRGKTNMQQIVLVILIIVLTLLSGITDAQGFLHASTTWVDGHIVWTEGLLG